MTTKKATTKPEATTEPKASKTPVSMVGIKMIGTKFYSEKDGFIKGFSSAMDCAKHFNAGGGSDG